MGHHCFGYPVNVSTTPKKFTCTSEDPLLSW